MVPSTSSSLVSPTWPGRCAMPLSPGADEETSPVSGHASSACSKMTTSWSPLRAPRPSAAGHRARRRAAPPVPVGSNGSCRCCDGGQPPSSSTSKRVGQSKCQRQRAQVPAVHVAGGPGRTSRRSTARDRTWASKGDPDGAEQQHPANGALGSGSMVRWRPRKPLSRPPKVIRGGLGPPSSRASWQSTASEPWPSSGPERPEGGRWSEAPVPRAPMVPVGGRR